MIDWIRIDALRREYQRLQDKERYETSLYQQMVLAGGEVMALFDINV